MFFSIIIATYNRRAYLAAAIDSVLMQSEPDFEIIVVDDGSTDDTADIITLYKSAHQNVHYVYQVNGERGKARNTGIENAKGDYMVFLDSDDLMYPSYLADLKTLINNQLEESFFALKFSSFAPDGKISLHQNFIGAGRHGIEAFITGNHLACNFCIVNDRSDPLLFVEDRKYITAEDWVFVLQAISRYGAVYLSDQLGVNMRAHEEQSMGNNLKVIAARKACTQWLLDHQTFTPQQQKNLKVYTAYFCAIHYYLEGSKKLALSEARTALTLGGLQPKFLTVAVKALLGRNTILSLKKLRSS